MALLGITDRSTVARLTELCRHAKDAVLEVNEKFSLASSSPYVPPPPPPPVPATDSAPAESVVDDDVIQKILLEVGSRYSTVMISLIQSLMRRQSVMPGVITRQKLGEVIDILRDLAPKLVPVCRGELELPGCIPRMLGAIDEAAELVKAVPQFSARLDVQFVTTDLDMAISKLRDALCSRNVTVIGCSARMMAQEVEDIVKRAVALGLAPEDAEAVRQAVARVIIAAKEAVSGDYVAGIQKFDAAVRDLESLMRSLPSKSIPKLKEDSFDLLSAARKLVTGGLGALMAEIKSS